MNVTITPQKVNVTINPASAGISVGNPITRDYVGCDPYTGEYTITPSLETQVIPIKNMRATDNITVNPVPNNYGLITWNGSNLIVS